MMKPEGKFVPRMWIYLFVGIDFFALGMFSFSKALVELQEKVTDFESSVWPFLISFSLSILFALGWQLSFLLKKFNYPFPEKWDFIISILFFPVLALIALFFAFLAHFLVSSRLMSFFSACELLLTSGLFFGLASNQRQKTI